MLLDAPLRIACTKLFSSWLGRANTPGVQGGLIRAMERAPGFAMESSVRIRALGDEAGAIGAALISSETMSAFKLDSDPQVLG
jgi:hypothetical protein